MQIRIGGLAEGFVRDLDEIEGGLGSLGTQKENCVSGRFLLSCRTGLRDKPKACGESMHLYHSFIQSLVTAWS